MFWLSSGIQQKYIIVTCNYVARELGVTKMMSVANAKEKCPQLVLVKGEDLTHYREMSYKVTGRQEQYITQESSANIDVFYLQNVVFSVISVGSFPVKGVTSEESVFQKWSVRDSYREPFKIYRY